MENFVDASDFVPLNQTSFTCDQELMKEEDFPFEVVDQSKPTSFLQDFHHLDHDHQFDQRHHNNHIGSTSSNPLLCVQTTSSCINNVPLEHCSYQENIFDFYESKPQLMNYHFQAARNSYFTNNHHQEINLVDEHDHMELEQNNMLMMRTIPFDYPPTEIIKPMNFVMRDEVSCISADNSYYKATNFIKNTPFLTRKLSSSSSSSSSWKGNKSSTLVKGQWTAQEDRTLSQLVEKYGLRKWSHIAQVLPGRIGKQCRERWHNHLRPDIKKESWSEEEDKVLIEFHKEIGNKWAEIAKRLPGRTENSIKNHWNATKRRQFSKRKCRSKYPRPSLLQDYIKSLDLRALSATSVPARGRRRETNKKKDVEETMKKKEEEFYGQDRIVPECVFADDFEFNEKLLEEGCSIDSLLDDISHHDIDAFVHGI